MSSWNLSQTQVLEELDYDERILSSAFKLLPK